MTKRGERASAEERQLYLLFKQLKQKISDVNDYASILGYAVFDALSSFHLSCSSEEERKFEEVKTVYARLENISRAINRDYFTILYDLQERIEKILEKNKPITIPLYEEETEDSSPFEGSRVFHEILETLESRRGNPLDRLRRSGNDLDSLVEERGLVQGNRNSLCQDYKDLYHSFIRGKGDRRD